MGLFKRLWNAVSADDDVGATGLDSRRLLEWLGIDGTKPEAISEATYYACLRILSETMGKLPLKYYQQTDEGRVRASPSEGVRLLMERPNPIMTPATFWTTLEANCQHYGNAYAWIQTRYDRRGRYGGEYTTVAYWPMQSQYTQVIMDDAGVFGMAGQLYYQYNDPKTGKEYVFRSDNVLHFKTWLTWDGVMGKSVRDILKGMVTGAGEAQKYLEQLYESGLTASSILQYTGDIDKILQKRLQKEYNDILTGAKNAGKVVPLPYGMTLTPLNIKLTDSQFYELKKYTALQIAAAFGVKPTQINDYEKASYASSEAQQLAFLVDTMLYRITQYEQEINFKCLDNKERKDGYFMKFNEKVILRTDASTQMQTITNAVQNGIYTPNEGREYLDLPSKDGGNQLIVNGNYIPLTEVGAAYGISQEGGNEE